MGLTRANTGNRRADELFAWADSLTMFAAVAAGATIALMAVAWWHWATWITLTMWLLLGRASAFLSRRARKVAQ